MNIAAETMEVESNGFSNPGRPLIGFWRWKPLPFSSSLKHSSLFFFCRWREEKTRKEGFFRVFAIGPGPTCSILLRKNIKFFLK